MLSCPTLLIVSTQTWFQVARLAMRFGDYGARLAAICPEACPLVHFAGIQQRFGFRLTRPLGSLRHAIAASGADYIVPTDDRSVAFLHELAAVSPSLRPLIERSIGPESSYPIVRSRFRLLELAHEMGIAVPETELIRQAGELERWHPVHGEGLVLKKDGTWGGRGVYVAYSQPEAERAFAALSRRASAGERVAQWLRIGDASVFAKLGHAPRPEISAQRFVRGVPANSMYACHQGQVLGEVQVRVAASKGKTGPSLVVQLMQDPRISRAGALLARKLELSGFFGLDFMLDEQTGAPFLIEMNPRSTQLGHVAVAGQPDLAGRLWAQWAGGALPTPAEPHLGAAVWFYPDGEQWTQATASFPGCRPDVQPAEREAVIRLQTEAAADTGGSRRRAWRAFARFKGAVGRETAPQPFYYQDLTQRAETAVAASAKAPRRASVVSFAG